MNCVSQSRFSYDKNGWSEIVPQKKWKKRSRKVSNYFEERIGNSSDLFPQTF